MPFVVNDSVEVALQCGADGVHVGQSDIKGRDIRAIIGPDKILGISAGTVEQAVAAEQAGADYIGVGAVFPTSTKKDAKPMETELLRRIAADGTRSVLFSTHITSDLEKCASHITFIKDGTIQHTGTLADFRQHYDYLRQPGQELTLEDIIVSVERRPLDENAIV